MKSTIKVKILISIILFSIFGCTNKVEETSKSTNKTESVILTKNKENDILDSSFIGKTSIELDDYNLHECFWSLLHGKSEEDKYCIAQYSKIIEDCRYGKGKIVFGKYANTIDGKTNSYEIIDELNVVTQDPKRVYYHVLLKLENNEENICLVEFEDNREQIITKVYRIWKIDFIKEKFVEVKKPKNLTFFNPDYLEE